MATKSSRAQGGSLRPPLPGFRIPNKQMLSDDRMLDFEAELQMDHWDAMAGDDANWKSDY